MKKLYVTQIFMSLLCVGLLACSSVSHAKKPDILPVSKLEVIVEFENESLEVHKSKLLSVIDTSYVHYTNLFGGVPKKVNGQPYDRLTVKLYEGFGGEADPETLDIGLSDIAVYGFYNWEVSVLHEMFHLWNAETFRYATGQEQWFNEGVTDYYTFRTAAEFGMISEDQKYDIFARPIGAYLSADGIGGISMRKAGSTSDLKRAHYSLIYRGGYVAAMVMDYQIRLESGGQHSLDDLMRELYKSNSRREPYSMETLQKSLHQSTGVDFSDFFKRYVDGTEIIPVGVYFDIGFLDILTKNGIPITDTGQRVLKDMFKFE